MRSFLWLGLVCCICCAVAAPEVFKPTQEWQEVHDGQEVPAGLHYKLDMAAGRKWARLIDEGDEETDDQVAVAVPVSGAAGSGSMMVVQEDSPSITQSPEQNNAAASPTATEMMENVLKKLPSPATQSVLSSKKRLSAADYEKALKRLWDKRQQEVAAAAAELRDEAKAIKDFTETLVSVGTSPEAKLHALDGLLYLVEQVDNAKDFVTLGGMAACTNLLVAAKDPRVIANAAWTIATAAQNNRPVQDAAVANGVIGSLMGALASASVAGDPGVSEAPRLNVVARTLFALMSLVRNNPSGERALLLADGFSHIAAATESANSTTAEACKARLKTIAFVRDITDSHRDTAIEANLPPSLIATRDEDKAAIHRILSSPRWCKLVAQSLHLCHSNDVWLEKILIAMEMQKDSCAASFNANLPQATLAQVLRSLKERGDAAGDATASDIDGVDADDAAFTKELLSMATALVGK